MDKLWKNRRHHWKKRLNSKISKFENDLLKTNEDIAPQRREILQTFVWVEGTNLPPPPPRSLIQTS